MAGVSVNISNVDVSFPFTPYDCQVDYMECVIKALQTKTNAILESPTGTGKTLCLLCAALGWRQTYMAQLQLNALSADSNIPGLTSAVGDTGSMAAQIKAPTIIYASRTHSQISQVVQELKNTIYKPKVAVLGSRDSLCLHPKVSVMQNSTQKIHACRAKTKDRSCVHYTNVERKITDPKFTDIMDIEELVIATKKLTMCPYFTSRELLRVADVIFMPYNYLLDLKTRKNQSIKLENSVIIFDEAHNIEKVCEDAFSVEITSLDIATCVENCQLALDRLCGEEEGDAGGGGGGKEGDELTKQDVLIMKSLFLSLEHQFNKLDVKEKGNILDKGFLKELFESIKITNESKEMVTTVCEKMEAVLSLSSNNIMGHTYQVLQKFRTVIDLTLSQTETSKTQYVCYASREQPQKGGQGGNPWKQTKVTTGAQSVNIKLSYWCFSPGLAMEDFAKQGVYNIILTSGTLSPLSSFSHELKIPFPITLQNPHVIEHSQLCVQVLTKGCDNTELVSTYQNRSDPKYLNSLGLTIVNFLRIIPQGVLIFFPSYMVMKICVEYWKEKSTIWQRMEKIKSVYQEPKSKNDLPEIMKEIDEKLKDPEHPGTVLMGVCRGKISEGIDFSDKHGRGVIITGMPFPPRMEPKVDAKIKFLDSQKIVEKRPDALGGEEWYKLQSTRAVNQAVGRVIRNKKDYGAVIFLDKRFSYQSNINQFPKWTKGSVKVNEKFGAAIRDLSSFFKSHQMKEPSTPIVSPAAPKVDTSRLSGMYKELMKKKEVRKEFTLAAASPEHNIAHTPPPNKNKRPVKRTSLITSLNSASETDFHMPASMSSPVSTKHMSATQENFTTPEVVRNPRKRIRLVAEKEDAVKAKSLFSDTSQTDTQGAPQVKIHKKENVAPKPASATQLYAAKLRSRLSATDYKKFLGFAAVYKKDKDPDELINSVKELFKGDQDLLDGFGLILNANHRDRYHELTK